MTKLKMSAIAEIMIRAEMRSEGEYYSEEALKEYVDSENGQEKEMNRDIAKEIEKSLEKLNKKERNDCASGQWKSGTPNSLRNCAFVSSNLILRTNQLY